ncbi:hypothetical protein HZH68_015207 [Vespula germanica]|uniref:Uncharacterized protein n=1 Tax=Vespula germanica TaxID=30212 RepID=A0A834J5G6_VESGE|nr:hypothetical protein HZH68_015207 [Vespula germanica]
MEHCLMLRKVENGSIAFHFIVPTDEYRPRSIIINNIYILYNKCNIFIYIYIYTHIYIELICALQLRVKENISSKIRSNKLKVIDLLS